MNNQQLDVPLSRDDLRTFQSTVLQSLTRLVDEGCALMGPFDVRVFVRRDARPFAGKPRLRRYGGLTCLPLHNFAGHIPPGGMAGLKYHLACLVERWPDTVQRCPKCHGLFARFRRHAEFCSRKCQSRVAARKCRMKKAGLRMKKLKRKDTATTSRTRITKQTKKGVRR